jgi:hypothetical protein
VCVGDRCDPAPLHVEECGARPVEDVHG